MPSLEYFVVCESSSVDRYTNRVSLFNVLEHIATTGFPGVFPQGICAVIGWNMRREEVGQDLQVVLRIEIPGEEPRDLSKNFTVRTKRHRTILTLQGLPLPRPGEYRFKILLDGDKKATHLVDVAEGRPELPPERIPEAEAAPPEAAEAEDEPPNEG